MYNNPSTVLDSATENAVIHANGTKSCTLLTWQTTPMKKNVSSAVEICITIAGKLFFYSAMESPLL